ncbi:MAG: hypothetical protein RR202_05100 [Bacteroidales bacterium]
MFFLIVLLSACQKNGREDAEATAKEFLGALKEQDIGKMTALYPEVSNIEIFYASDTSYIEESFQLPKELIQVNAVSKYVNEEGEQETHMIVLFLQKPVGKYTSSYVILDSFGLCSAESYPHYQFARNTGCITEEEQLTDQQSIRQLKIAKDLLFFYAKQLYQELEENVQIVRSTIQEQDSDQAKGHALVQNNSDYTLPDLRYIIVYYNDKDQEIGNEGGWVTQEALPSGKAIQFEFTTNFNQEAATAAFKLDFDLDLILQFVLEDDIYTGNEYHQYVSKEYVDI